MDSLDLQDLLDDVSLLAAPTLPCSPTVSLVTLTPHQQTALDWLVERVVHGAPLVALRGYAGTGKTTLLPHLCARLAEHHLATTIGAPTHRAAMILRQKGLDEADTLHAHALTPYFTPDYATAARWLGEDVPCQWTEPPHDAIDGVPWLIHTQLRGLVAEARALRRHRGRVRAKKLLSNLGIHGKDCFAGFGPKVGEGVLLLDEASMVGRKMLTLCQGAFQQIVLIGDPGQLPPVKDEAMLGQVEGVELTEIHRQAADSPIIQLAYRARQGEPFWRQRLDACEASGLGGAVVELAQADVTALLEAPLIVWRNDTRLMCTHQIRQTLGYAKDVLMPGEPLVCRSSSPDDRADGFYNNALYRVIHVSAGDARRVTMRDAFGEEQTVIVHMEEVDGAAIPYQAIPFRWGYCLTAHTAQGGEWPTVYVSRPDLLRYAAACRTPERQKDLQQWSYTAITRAKETLCFLTHHAFTRSEPMPSKSSGPTTAPMLTLTPEPEPDDIADPVVPVEALAEAGEEERPSLRADLEAASAQAGLRPVRVSQDLLTGHAVADANLRLAGLVGALERAELSVADLGADQIRKLRTALRMPHEASDALAVSPQASVVSQGTWAEHEAQIHAFLSDLQVKVGKWLRDEATALDHQQDKLLVFLKDWVEKTSQANEHAQYQLSHALLALQEHGLPVLHPPYQVVVQAVSPAGYGVALTVTKPGTEAGMDALVDELVAMTGWLQSQGYTATR